MKIATLHCWNLNFEEAVALQRRLADRIDKTSPLNDFQVVAGADISYNRFSSKIYAGVVVLRNGTVIEKQGMVTEATFPYRTGLLSFREGPAVLQLFERIQAEPDLIMLDGAGYAHPRRFGLACHLGLWLDRPCIGCAKSRLIGDYDEPEPQRGSTSPLMHKGEMIGSVVRTKAGVKPLFVSIGHKIDMNSTVRAVLALDGGYRVPEPTRLAHIFVNELRELHNQNSEV